MPRCITIAPALPCAACPSSLRLHRWESIELEDDESVWEVGDAIGADGREYDLELRFGTLEIVDRDAD